MRRVIVLRDKSTSFAELGLSREIVATGARRLRALDGMPMLTDPPDRIYSTLEASGAHVGARMHGRDRVERLLRALDEQSERHPTRSLVPVGKWMVAGKAHHQHGRLV